MASMRSEREDCLGPLDTILSGKQQRASLSQLGKASPSPPVLRPLSALSFQPVSSDGGSSSSTSFRPGHPGWQQQREKNLGGAVPATAVPPPGSDVSTPLFRCLQVLNKLSKTSVVIDVINNKQHKMYSDKVCACASQETRVGSGGLQLCCG